MMKKVITLTLTLMFIVLTSSCMQQKPDPKPALELTSKVQPPPASETTPMPRSTLEQVESDEELAAPKFANYAVTDTFDGETAKLVFTKETQTFKSRFEAAAKGNFKFRR